MVAALDEALARADDLLARGAVFEDILAALDACLGLPGSDDARPGIEHRRLAACRTYGRSEAEVEQALLAFRRVEPDPVRIASATLATCARYCHLDIRRPVLGAGTGAGTSSAPRVRRRAALAARASQVKAKPTTQQQVMYDY